VKASSDDAPNKVLDPTRPMSGSGWKKAWHKIRAKAGLGNFRFYDGRHTVITTLQEKGVPDWVIQAQRHVIAEEAKPYSQVWRKALDRVALLLGPA
jgi:integrase